MARPLVRCKGCRRKAVAATITENGPYCLNCYKNILAPKRCGECGKTVRAERSARRPVCSPCRRKIAISKLKCSLCHRPIKGRVGKDLAGRRIIGTCCYTKVARLTKCGYCMQMHRGCSRSVAHGITRRACPKCLRDRLPLCHICRSRRRPFEIRDGHPLCKSCAHGQTPRHPCVECGRLSIRLAYGRCSFHAARFYVPKVVLRLSNGLKQGWSKTLFARYGDLLLERACVPRCVPGYLRKDIGFFMKLDSSFTSLDSLSAVSLATVLGPEDLSRFRRASAFLTSEKHIGSLADAEVQWELHQHRASRIRKTLASGWARAAFDAFHSHMHAQRLLYQERGHKRVREPTTVKGVMSALIGAHHLLRATEARGGTDVTAISQRDIDNLLASTRLLPQRLGRFVAYLNENTRRFSRLRTIKRGGTTGIPAGTLTATSFDRLVGRLLKVTDRRDVRGAVIALLCLLYAQTPNRVLSLKRDFVRQSDGHWEVLFAKEWVTLSDGVGRLLGSWMTGRRESSIIDTTNSSQFVFPGRKPGFPMTTDGFHCWLRPWGVKPQQLHSSGVANLVRSPHFSPRVAVDLLGITHSGISKYLDAMAPMQASQIAELVKHK